MKIKSFALSSSLLLGALALPACGSSSPDNYIEKSTKLSCKYTKKCEEAMWDEAGYDSVRDCVDQTLDAELLPGAGTARDLFVETCTDFDSSAARQCLSALRKARRSCDVDDVPTEDQEACASVCGELAPEMGALMLEPGNEELVARMLEQLELDGELDGDDEPRVSEDERLTTEP
ncbi:MAG: hypothetical protein AAGF11_33735 [Myxococcota bacterium]